MADKLLTPKDELTGLPLPILPEEPSCEGSSLFNDYHHHFHPRLNQELTADSGRSLRYCRGQKIARYLHDRYHHFFEGPELPDNNRDKFKLCVLACAGVVPRQAIDLSESGGYEIVELSDEQFIRLASSRSIYIENSMTNRKRRVRNTIGRFFASYAISQDVRERVSDKVIKEFLYTGSSPERKKELGNFILKNALDISLVEITDIHTELRREGYVSPTRATQPADVVNRFFPNYLYSDYHTELADRLLLTA